MSGHSYGTICPNCGEELNAYSDHKPFDTVSGECMYCGFCYYTKSDQMSLEEMNELREDYNNNTCFDDTKLKPLKKLPKINKELIY